MIRSLASRLAYGAARRLGRVAAADRVVLCYHSISSGGATARGYVGPGRTVDVEALREQLTWVTAHARVVSLGDLLEAEGREEGGPLVAITFDDGYYDNLAYGLPLFEAFEVPVTWFVATQFVEEPTTLPWWDLADYASETFRQPLTMGGVRYEMATAPGRRTFRGAMREVMLRPGPAADAAAAEVRRQLETAGPLPANAMARPEEVAAAAQSPWITLGGHTHSHPNVGQVGPDVLADELARSTATLRAWGGSPSIFAFPYGRPGTAPAAAVPVLEAHGYRASVTTEAGGVARGADAHRVPRVTVQGAWTQAMLETWVMKPDLMRTLTSLRPR